MEPKDLESPKDMKPSLLGARFARRILYLRSTPLPHGKSTLRTEAVLAATSDQPDDEVLQ